MADTVLTSSVTTVTESVIAEAVILLALAK